MRVALIDSGIHARHPHLAGARVVAGPTWRRGRASAEEPLDLHGHGTAIAAAIHELAPQAELYVLRVFPEELRASFTDVLLALEHALGCGARLVNLSLGTTDERWRPALEALGGRAAAAGIQVVSPRSLGGTASLPGSLPGFVGVEADARLERAHPEQRLVGAERIWFASPYPRDLPGLARERNLQGASFAAANLCGFLARQGASTSQPSP